MTIWWFEFVVVANAKRQQVKIARPYSMRVCMSELACVDDEKKNRSLNSERAEGEGNVELQTYYIYALHGKKNKI